MKSILSIDGGGVRGLIPAILCTKLEELCSAPIADLFDLVAGTSTGGLIALSLTAPGGYQRPASDLVDLYENHAERVFSRPRGVIRHVRGPKYDGVSLKSLVNEYFGQQKMSDSSVETLITAYDIRSRRPVFYSRRSAKEGNGDYLMQDVAMGTSAAPTYFPPCKIGDCVVVDGGVVANNPAHLAIAEARKIWPYEDLLVVSMGTGQHKLTIEFSDAVKWGDISWAKPLIDCFFDASSHVVEGLAPRYVSENKYWRFQANVDGGISKLDGTDKATIDGLRIVANGVLESRRLDFVKIATLLPSRDLRSKHRETAEHSLSEIKACLDYSSSIPSSTFQIAVDQRMSDFLSEAEQWRKRQMIVPPSDSQQFLTDLYREATHSVFATSIKAFSGAFRGTKLVSDILAANKASTAAITRLYVFRNANEIDGLDFHEMICQNEAKVTVLVHFTDGGDDQNIEDFTIIDSDAVGITRFVSQHEASGEWIFDKVTTDEFTERKHRLLEQSIHFDDFCKDNRVRFKLWKFHALVDVTEHNVDDYQQLSSEAFGTDVAGPERVLSVQRKAGAGAYLVRRMGRDAYVGILTMFPLSRVGFRRFESGEVKSGTDLEDSDITSRFNVAQQPIAYYLGAIAGKDQLAKATLLDQLKCTIRELADAGVESVFARPVSLDGLRVVEKLNFGAMFDSDLPTLNHMCRLRL